MWTVMLALSLGFVCGLLPHAKRFQKANRLLNTVGLFTLLGGMGIGLGGNPVAMSSLPLIGWSAVVLAGLTVLGSILLTLPLGRWLSHDRQQEEVSAEE